MDIGEPMPSDHNDEESDGEPTQIEVKFQVYDTDDDLHLHNCLEPNHTEYHPELTDEFADEPLSVAQDESTSQENYGNRTNEERPLMDGEWVGEWVQLLFVLVLSLCVISHCFCLIVCLFDCIYLTVCLTVSYCLHICLSLSYFLSICLPLSHCLSVWLAFQLGIELESIDN